MQLYEKYNWRRFHYGNPTGAVLSAGFGKLSHFCSVTWAKVKVKTVKGKSGVPFCGAVHLGDQIFHALRVKLFSTMPLSHQVYSVWDVPTKTYKLLPSLYLWSYTLLQGLLIPPMAFTISCGQCSNWLPLDGRASTITTQPIRLAL